MLSSRNMTREEPERSMSSITRFNGDVPDHAAEDVAHAAEIAGIRAAAGGDNGHDPEDRG